MKLMTVIRARAASLYFILPLCCAIFFLSVQSSASNKVSSFSGEQYFRGVFYGDGAVAEAIPALADLNIRNYLTNPAHLNDVLTLQNNIVSQIIKTQPAFFAAFQREMASHDQVRILNAMNSGKDAVLNAMVGMYHCANQADLIAQTTRAANSIHEELPATPSKEQMRQLAEKYMPQTVKLDATEDIQCLLVILIVVAAAVYYAAVYWEVKFWEATASSDNQLFREQVANSISKL